MSEPLRVGQIALSFHVAAAAVVIELLRELGHEIVVREAPHEDMYTMLGADEVDLVVSAWLPDSHGKYIASYEDTLLKLGVLYHPYCIWGIPDFAPPEVASVSDLARPEIAALFDKLIQGIGPGAGISRFSRQMVEDYGLAEQGFHFENGSLDDCTQACLSAFEDRRLAVVPLWHPQWLHHQIKFRALKDPRGLLGGQDDATLVLRKAARDKLSDRGLSLLSRMTLGNDVVSMLDKRISVDGQSPEDAAREWISANRTQCDAWLTA